MIHISWGRSATCGWCRTAASLTSSVYALLLSFAVVFIAELGDKSQLLALTFATRFPRSSGVDRHHCGDGCRPCRQRGHRRGLGASLPTTAIPVLAALGLRLRRLDAARRHLSSGEASKAGRTTRSAVVAVAVAFFLAELGDKTMLATVTLATREDIFGTCLGSTLGMVAADARWRSSWVSNLVADCQEKVIRYGAAASFVLFGVLLLIDAIW